MTCFIKSLSRSGDDFVALLLRNMDGLDTTHKQPSIFKKMLRGESKGQKYLSSAAEDGETSNARVG